MAADVCWCLRSTGGCAREAPEAPQLVASMNRRILTTTLAVSALALLPGIAQGTAPPGRAAQAAHSPSGPHAPEWRGDADHDRVSDDLAGSLDRAEPGDRLRVIVSGLRAGPAQQAVGHVAVKYRYPLIDGFAATMTAAQVRALAGVPGVHRIEGDGTMRALDDGTNHDFGATAAQQDLGLTGAGVGICVVDTGIDPAHEQIAPRSVTFTDFVNGRSAPYDDHGHGTHVAAIAAGDGTGGSSAATFVGVAPGADLFAAKVLDSAGQGADSDVLAGVQWCADQPGVDVVSMSIGGDTGDGTDAVSQAIDALAARSVHPITSVVAAGNSGDLPATVNVPGVAAGAITVGAVSDYSAPAGTARHDDGIWLAAFSSRGPVVDGSGRFVRTKPDIASPGVSVTSAQAGTTSGYVTLSGTSMATPYVAGAVALALEKSPTASPAALKAALQATAVDVGVPGIDDEWGAGLIDVPAFVQAAAGASASRLPFPTVQHVSGTVPDNGRFDLPIALGSGDLGVPLAATVTVAGQELCYFSCLYVEWTPDLDVQLLNPAGTVVATSECALDGLSCGVGRQETIGVQPTTAGTWILRVIPFSGDPNDGQGGSFTVDVTHGPVVGASAPPPPPENTAPTADAGPDQTVTVNRKTGVATFTLDGSASTDLDGDALSSTWSLGGTVVGSTATLQESRPAGSYTYTLTVADGRGGSDTDTVLVTVVAKTRGGGGHGHRP